MRFVPKSPRMRWLASLLVLVLAGAGGMALFAYSLSQPHPERYAAGVLSGGTAQQEVLANPVARAYLRDFRTQESFASCGPASVVNVLASLGAPVAGERALFADKPWGRLSMRVLLDVTPGYGPSLIPSRLLYTAVQTIDSATGRSRGLLRISDISALAGPVGPGPDGPVPGSPHTTPRRSP